MLLQQTKKIFDWTTGWTTDKTGIFDRPYLITNFYVLKLWLTLIKEFGGDILIEN